MHTRELMNQSQYAASRGYSKQYISKLIMLGKIRRHCLLVDERGRTWIDPILADQDMANNCPGFISNNPSGLALERD